MFQNNAFAKVWKVMDNGDLQISTSYKTADGAYQTDFSGYVKNKSENIPKQGDLIKLLKTGVKQNFNPETKKTTTNFFVFDLEIRDFGNNSKEKTKPQKTEKNEKNIQKSNVGNSENTNESLLEIMSRDDLPF